MVFGLMCYLCLWTIRVGDVNSDVFVDALALILKEVRSRALNFASPKSKQTGDSRKKVSASASVIITSNDKPNRNSPGK